VSLLAKVRHDSFIRLWDYVLVAPQKLDFSLRGALGQTVKGQTKMTVELKSLCGDYRRH